MEVVYVKQIWDRILEAKHEADMNRKTIDYIKLTKQEAEKLYDYMETKLELIEGLKRQPWMFYEAKDYKAKRVHQSHLYGINLKVSGY